MYDEFNSRAIANIGYNSVARVMQFVISAIGSIILTRTLLPSDYGIVGFAGIFISFLSQFGDFGITNAAIQKKELNDVAVYTAFTLKICLSFFVFVVAFFLAPLTIHFFDNKAIVSVVRVLSFIFILNSFSFLPNLLLTRDLNFKKISYANVASAFLYSAAAVVFALLGFEYWSLVIASILMTISMSVLLNAFHPVRYRLMYNHEAALGFMKFGVNLFLSGFMVFISFNADNFLIGSMKGSASLGYYSVAFTWGSMACTIISSIVLSVLFPTLSKIKEDSMRLKTSYLEILRYVSFCGVLVNMTLLVISKELLVFVLGHNTDKWMPALLSLRILCIYGIVRLLLEPVGPVMMSLGRTDVIRKAIFILTASELGGLYPALYFFGIEGVAVLVTVTYLAQYAVYYRVLRSELQVSLKEIWTSVAPAFFTIVPFGIIFLVGEAVFGFSPLGLVTKVACCTFVYIVSYGLASNWKLYKDMRILIKYYV